jgi:hypothetical protein
MHSITISILLFLTTLAASAQNGMLTARERFDDIATQVKDKHGSDTRLLIVMAYQDFGGLPVDVDARSGKAHMWIYAFYEPSENVYISTAVVSHPSLGDLTIINDPEPSPYPAPPSAIPAHWLDSDASAAAWRQHGLQNFFDTRPNAQTVGIMLRSYEERPPTWDALVTDNTDSLECSVDAVSAALISCDLLTNMPDIHAALKANIGTPFPNPARQGTDPIIEVRMLSAGELRASVYDITGRLQGDPLVQQVQPGYMSLVIPRELFPRPGMYFIRVDQHGMTVSRRILVIP